jgi:hypothetical protein
MSKISFPKTKYNIYTLDVFIKPMVYFKAPIFFWFKHCFNLLATTFMEYDIYLHLLSFTIILFNSWLNIFLSYISHKINNNINFYLSTQPNYMFDNFTIHFKVTVIQPKKIH